MRDGVITLDLRMHVKESGNGPPRVTAAKITRKIVKNDVTSHRRTPEDATTSGNEDTDMKDTTAGAYY